MTTKTTTIVTVIAASTVGLLIYLVAKSKKATTTVVTKGTTAKPVAKASSTSVASGLWSIVTPGNIGAITDIFTGGGGSSAVPAVQIDGSTYTFDSGTQYNDDNGNTYDASTGKVVIGGVTKDAGTVVVGTVSGTDFTASFDGVKGGFDGVKKRNALI